MQLLRVLGLVGLVGCANAPPLHVPSPSVADATIVVGSREVLLVFPADSVSDFPWPAAQLANAAAAPWWGMMAYPEGADAIGIALTLMPVDSLKLDPVNRLEEAISRLRLYRCSQDGWIVYCGTRSSGSAHVDAGRVVLRFTDRGLVRDLLKAHPSSAWLLVRRANQGQATHFSRQMRIQYLGGA